VSALSSSGGEGRSRVAFEPLALGALLMLGLLYRYAHLTSVFAVAATIAIGASAMAPRWRSTVSNQTAVASGAVTVAVLLSVWGVYVYRAAENAVTLGFVAAVGAFLITMLRRHHDGIGQRVRLGVMIALIVLVVLISHMSINQRSAPGLDTLRIHDSAAEEILKGENPYLTATAPNSYIFAPEGSEWVGYVYPPTTLVAFAGADILFGDSRWASTIAIAAFVALLLAPWSQLSTPVGAVRAGVALAFVAMPELWIIIWGAWTDLIALPFLLGAAYLWKRHPLASAVLLGLALSTKPYFLPVLPLLLLWPSGPRIKRLVVVGGVVIATYLPFLLLDAPSVLKTFRLEDLVDSPYRPDSIGLAGLGINVPRFLSAAVALTAGVILGRRGGRTERFFMAMAAVLSVAFLTAVQVFINYWFLIAGLLIIALAVMYEDADVQDDEESDDSSAVPA
jgi:hypothetical protein